MLAKFDGDWSFGNGVIHSCVNSYMNTSKEVELKASVCHVETFSKSGMTIFNSEVPEKFLTRVKKAIAKRYPLQASAISGGIAVTYEHLLCFSLQKPTYKFYV